MLQSPLMSISLQSAFLYRLVQEPLSLKKFYNNEKYYIYELLYYDFTSTVPHLLVEGIIRSERATSSRHVVNCKLCFSLRKKTIKLVMLLTTNVFRHTLSNDISCLVLIK